jgi:hypothetical protein
LEHSLYQNKSRVSIWLNKELTLHTRSKVESDFKLLNCNSRSFRPKSFGQADKLQHVSPHNKQAAFEQRSNPNQHYWTNHSKYILFSQQKTQRNPTNFPASAAFAMENKP